MHHYLGYDKPFKVWFVCYGCNSAFTQPDKPGIRDARGDIYNRIYKVPSDLSHARNIVMSKLTSHAPFYNDKEEKTIFKLMCCVCGTPTTNYYTSIEGYSYCEHHLNKVCAIEII